MLFTMRDNPISTPCNTWFLRPMRFSPHTASRSVQPFLQGSRTWQTDRQTDRQTIAAMRPKTRQTYPATRRNRLLIKPATLKPRTGL